MSWLTAFQRPLLTFVATPFLAVAVGSVVRALSGFPAGVLGRNPAAWLVGGLSPILGAWLGVALLAAVARRGGTAKRQTTE